MKKILAVLAILGLFGSSALADNNNGNNSNNPPTTSGGGGDGSGNGNPGLSGPGNS